jgi:uncharacterized DUF497 family protein
MTKKHTYNFSGEKNYKLIQERGISFEEVISVIESDSLLDIIEHPNSQKYSNQRMYIIEFNNYAYLVPFIIEIDGTIFLKTIIPSRKATERYLKKERRENEK